jgi:6-phosphogluconolactonase
MGDMGSFGVCALVGENATVAAESCAGQILRSLKDALAVQPYATLAVSGGTSPKLMFAEMAKSAFDWSRVHLFWVDERCVPPTDSQSNYKLAKENFIDPSHFPSANVHRVQGELPPQEAAKLYDKDIRLFFQLADGAVPQFDVIHRGIGPDAHTASLFPGEPLIDDHKNRVAAVYVEKFHQWRVTLLPAVLEAARLTVTLAAGEDKAEPLRAVMEAPTIPRNTPRRLGRASRAERRLRAGRRPQERCGASTKRRRG